MAGLNVWGSELRVASPVPRLSETSPLLSRHIQVDCGGRHFDTSKLLWRARPDPHAGLQVWRRGDAEKSGQDGVSIFRRLSRPDPRHGQEFVGRSRLCRGNCHQRPVVQDDERCDRTAPRFGEAPFAQRCDSRLIGCRGRCLQRSAVSGGFIA